MSLPKLFIALTIFLLAGCGVGDPGRALGQFARLEVDCQLGLQVDAQLQRKRHNDLTAALNKAKSDLEALKSTPNLAPPRLAAAQQAVSKAEAALASLTSAAINNQNMDRLIQTGTDDKGRQPLFRCEFRNEAKVAAQSCVKIKVTPPNAPTGRKGPLAVVSETVCSGTLLPDTDEDGVTDAIDRCPSHGSAHEGGGSYDVDAQGCIQKALRAETSPGRCVAGQTQTGRCAAEVFLGSVPQAFITLAPRERCFQSHGGDDGAFMCVSARNFIIASCFDDEGKFLCDLQIDEMPL